jgi:Photosynthetic reaction centre cytochrome C subunit
MEKRRFGSRRAALIVIGILSLTIGFAVFGLAQGRQAPRPKNLKVLRNLPPGQLIPMMRQFNASLGVRCDFCHVVNPDRTGYDRDDKPQKGTARKMILMMNDINAHQKVLEKKATCFMCHHGSAKPQTAAPMELRGGPGGGRPGFGGGQGGPRRGPGGGR